jgi:hypothetical protein
VTLTRLSHLKTSLPDDVYLRVVASIGFNNLKTTQTCC